MFILFGEDAPAGQVWGTKDRRALRLDNRHQSMANHLCRNRIVSRTSRRQTPVVPEAKFHSSSKRDTRRILPHGVLPEFGVEPKKGFWARF